MNYVTVLLLLCSSVLFTSKKLANEYVTAYIYLAPNLFINDIVFELMLNLCMCSTRATSNYSVMDNTITRGLEYLFWYSICPLVHFIHPLVSRHLL